MAGRSTDAGDRLLEAATGADLCAAASVVEFLRLRPQLAAAVRADGAIFAVEPARAQRRDLRALARTVRTAMGADRPEAGEVLYVSEQALERWRSRHRPKSAAERAEDEVEQNRLVTAVFDAAIAAKASDVYIDVDRKGDATRVRHRVYGRALEVDAYTAERGDQLCRSLWAQSESGQFDFSAPCDCAFDYRVPEVPGGARTKLYRVRANAVKDVLGNSVVCRIRDPGFVLPLAEAGYSERQMEHIRGVAASPGGLLLITGETNSGKSTTAASLMGSLPQTLKIIEIADPVEVVFPHITHIEVNRYHEDAEGVFRRTLAATVRQNPDVLVLGEIRDEMTAEAAMSMAIQGKRVLSTVHTQSCASAIPRLEQLGVEEHLLGLREFIAGIVNQNLVPLVCPECALERHPDGEREERYRELFGGAARHINPEGCDAPGCAGGVVGQTLVAEVYPLCLDRTGEPHKRIARKDYVGLEAYMREEWGAVGKHEHARSKVEAGLVDPAECERIIGAWTDDGAGKAAPVVQLDAKAG